jgi:hypothetical protein
MIISKERGVVPDLKSFLSGPPYRKNFKRFRSLDISVYLDRYSGSVARNNKRSKASEVDKNIAVPDSVAQTVAMITQK